MDESPPYSSVRAQVQVQVFYFIYMYGNSYMIHNEFKRANKIIYISRTTSEQKRERKTEQDK